MDLNKVMEFNHVILVNEDGSVTDAPNIYAPEIHVDTDDDGQILDEHESAMVEYVRSQGWELLTGYTGQYGYHGPIMHQSEFIGGGLARDILAEPGIYVALVIETSDDSDEAAGWAVARQNGYHCGACGLAFSVGVTGHTDDNPCTA